MRVAYEIEKTGFATEADTSTKSLVCIRCGSRLLQHPRWSAFVITVNDWKLLTIITKHSILDVAAALDPPLGSLEHYVKSVQIRTRKNFGFGHFSRSGTLSGLNGKDSR